MGLSVFSTKEFGESCEESETGGGIQNPEVQEPEAIQGQGNKIQEEGAMAIASQPLWRKAFADEAVC